MPTRADFYLGTGTGAEWLGSIGMDGYPSSVLAELSLDAGQSIASADDWRESVAAVLGAHGEATHPDWGWPWPWDDSRTTDYAYTWTPDSPVLVSCFGSRWMTPQQLAAIADEDLVTRREVFPDMSARKEVRWDAGNAPMILGAGGRLQNPPVGGKNRPKEPSDG